MAIVTKPFGTTTVGRLTHNIHLQHRKCSVARAKPDENESRMEFLERKAKGKMTTDDMETMAAARALAKQVEDNVVVWKEGQLFPEKWDQMDNFQKANQLYMGERGFIFWINKAAYASAIGIGVVWIAFRVIGPATGLYKID